MYVSFCYNKVTNSVDSQFSGYNKYDVERRCRQWAYFTYDNKRDYQVYVFNRNFFRFLHATGLLRHYLNISLYIRYRVYNDPELYEDIIETYEHYLDSKPHKPRKERHIAFIPKIGICYDHRAKEIKYLARGVNKRAVRGECLCVCRNQEGKVNWHVHVVNKYLFKVLVATHLLAPYLKRCLKVRRIRYAKKYAY